MKISFLNHKFGEQEPISLDLEDEIGDVVIEGFRGDSKFVITVSDAPVEEEDSQAAVLARVCMERKNENGAVKDRKLVLLYKQKIDTVNKIQKIQRFTTVVSVNPEGQWQPKNVYAIIGMPPE